jgi:hypothetical protein
MLLSPASVHEIAQRLHLSIKTIHNLHYQIKSKLGADSDIKLTRLALSWGLDLEPAPNTGRRSPLSAGIAAPRSTRLTSSTTTDGSEL